MQSSSGKIMRSVFWDPEDIMLAHNYMASTVLTFFTSYISQLQKSAKEIDPGTIGHDCPRCMSNIEEYYYHPPYSPDLARFDYHIFPNLKKYLREQRFLTDDTLGIRGCGRFADRRFADKLFDLF